MPESNDSSTIAVKTERSDDMQEEGGEANNNGNSNSKGEGNGEGEVTAGNHSAKGDQVSQGPREQEQQDDPNGQQSSASAAERGGGSGGDNVHAGQKRKIAESVTDDTTGTDDDDGGPAPKIHKSEAARSHPDFWHPDGSVIIQVENTKFRLHQSTLQKNSAYFAAAFRERKYFEVVEVEVDEQSPNGHHLPVYRVTETTADDFATLLTLIEEPLKYADEIPPMPVLAGVLRAACALTFKAQRMWAERKLLSMWPGKLTPDPKPHAAIAFSLARTCGLRCVQNRASYELIRMPTFWKAIVAALAVHSEVQEDSHADADAEMGLDKLPRADLLTLLHVREQLVLAWAEVARRAPMDFVCPYVTQMQLMPENGDRNGNNGRRSGCAYANADRLHARWAELVHTSGLYVQRMADPFMGLQDLKAIPWREKGFCKKCVAAMTDAWEESGKKLCDDLKVWLKWTGAENV